jgi:hypothetical protein
VQGVWSPRRSPLPTVNGPVGASSAMVTAGRWPEVRGLGACYRDGAGGHLGEEVRQDYVAHPRRRSGPVTTGSAGARAQPITAAMSPTVFTCRTSLRSRPRPVTRSPRSGPPMRPREWAGRGSAEHSGHALGRFRGGWICTCALRLICSRSSEFLSSSSDRPAGSMRAVDGRMGRGRLPLAKMTHVHAASEASPDAPKQVAEAIPLPVPPRAWWCTSSATAVRLRTSFPRRSSPIRRRATPDTSRSAG